MARYLKLNSSASAFNQTTTQVNITQTITTNSTSSFSERRYEDNNLFNNEHNKLESRAKEMESIKELFSSKETVIIKSLIYLNKNNTEPNKHNFYVRQLNYSQAQDQSINEKTIFESIDRIVRKRIDNPQQRFDLPRPLTLSSIALNEYNNTITNANGNGKSSNELGEYNPNEPNGNDTKKKQMIYKVDSLICKLKEKNKSLEFIAIKCIIISFINIINEWMAQRSDCMFNSDLSYIDSSIFRDIYEQFLLMTEICPLLEINFSESLHCFRRKYEIFFTLQELLCDIFWDYIFKLKRINCLFVDSFKSDDIQDEAQTYMKQIIQVLWMIELPLMKNIGEILEITAITNEKTFLATYLINYKSQLIYNTSKKIIQTQFVYNSVMHKKVHVQLKDNMEIVKINMKTQTMTKEEIEADVSDEEYEEEDEDEGEGDGEGDIDQDVNEEEDIDLDVDNPEIGLENEGDEDINLENQLQQEIALQKHIEHEHEAILQEKYNKKIQEGEQEQMEALKLLAKSESETLSLPSLQPLIQPKQSYSLLKKAQQEQKEIEEQRSQIDTNQFKTNEEVYNDILDNSNHKTGKKRNKKRRKRKNTYNNDDNNNDNYDEDYNNPFKHTSNGELDQMIEQFHLDIKASTNMSYQIQKIKPKFSTDWLKSISA